MSGWCLEESRVVIFPVASYYTVNQAVHKNNYVSGIAAGWLKKVRLETFFFTFAKEFCFKHGQYFHTKKKVEKNNCGCPTGFNFSQPLDRKHFFYGQPQVYKGIISGGGFGLRFLCSVPASNYLRQFSLYVKSITLV